MRRRRSTGFYNLTVEPTPPNAISGLAAWYDGRQQAYSDINGTVQQSAVRGPVGRVYERAPLTSYWAAPDNASRPALDVQGVRSDYAAEYNLVRPAVDLSLFSSTFAITFTTRAGWSVTQNLLRIRGAVIPHSGYCLADRRLGFLVSDASGIIDFSTLTIPEGVRNTLVIRNTSSGVRVRHLVDGAVAAADYTRVVPYLPGATTGPANSWSLGAGAFARPYATVSQLVAFSRILSDAEAVTLGDWCAAQAITAGFPTDAPIFGVIGDSISQATGGSGQWTGWPWLSRTSLQAAYPGLEYINAGRGGSRSTDGPGQFVFVNAQYSASRSRNVIVFAHGTNDLGALIPPATAAATQLATVDTAIAAGWRPMILRVLPRVFPGYPGGQSAFDTDLVTLNGLLAAGCASRGIPFVASIPGMDTTADMADPAKSTDGAHPNDGGYALMAAAIAPVIATRLA